MSVLRKVSITGYLASLGTLILLLAAPAGAQQEGALEVTTTVQKVVVVETEDGTTRTEYVEADTVVPGERVFYTIRFRNVGKQPAENVVITNPISTSLVYVDGSALQDGLQVEFSVDGGQSFASADALRVDDDGEQRQAIARDYTHVRWVMLSELAVGDEGLASFAADLE